MVAVRVPGWRWAVVVAAVSALAVGQFGWPVLGVAAVSLRVASADLAGVTGAAWASSTSEDVTS